MKELQLTALKSNEIYNSQAYIILLTMKKNLKIQKNKETSKNGFLGKNDHTLE